jgi:hypothetical protein
MGPAEEMTHLARELAASYEARVSSVEQIIAGTHEMLETFRSQREAMRSRLREALARAASLRRRDFDTMMEGILAQQEARELQIKETMRDYLREQRVLAATLKETLSAHLGRIQAEPARRDAERAGAGEELLGGIMARRQAREREVRFLLAEFQREQEEIARALEGLLSNGGSLKVKEFKAALKLVHAHGTPCAPRGGGADD